MERWRTWKNFLARGKTNENEKFLPSSSMLITAWYSTSFLILHCHMMQRYIQAFVVNVTMIKNIHYRRRFVRSVMMWNPTWKIMIDCAIDYSFFSLRCQPRNKLLVNFATFVSSNCKQCMRWVYARHCRRTVFPLLLFYICLSVWWSFFRLPQVGEWESWEGCGCNCRGY